jgi:hypothetical protein
MITYRRTKDGYSVTIRGEGLLDGPVGRLLHRDNAWYWWPPEGSFQGRMWVSYGQHLLHSIADKLAELNGP